MLTAPVPPALPGRVARPEGYVAGGLSNPTVRSPAPNKTSSGGQPDMPLRPGEWRPDESTPPKPEKRPDEKEGHKKDEKDSQRLAEVRGHDWALCNQARAATPVTRPINILCGPDRLVVVGNQARRESESLITLHPQEAVRVDTFISTIWKRMNEWGIAGNGMYWRPILNVRVLPGGEERFRELSVLLEGSGLTVRKVE